MIFDTTLADESALEVFEAAVEVVASLTGASGMDAGGCTLVLGGDEPQWIDPGFGAEGDAAVLEALASAAGKTAVTRVTSPRVVVTMEDGRSLRAKEGRP